MTSLSKILTTSQAQLTPTESKQWFIDSINHFIRQMPGFVAWKTVDSVYASSNQLCAELAGYKNIESFIGTNDYDWKCEAVEVANQLRAQDASVLESGKDWSSLNTLKFSNGSITFYNSNKSILRDPNGEILGILFIGTILNNSTLLKALTSIAQHGPVTPKKIQSNIYPVVKKDDGEMNLSQRQSECLFFLLRGKSSKETGRILGLSSRTVETYIEQIKTKFGCHLRSQLIEKAIDNGYFYHIPSSLFEKNLVNIC